MSAETAHTSQAGADKPADTALQLWLVLARACGALAACAEQDVERYDLTPGQFGVLEALFHKGPLLLGELQRKQLVSSGGVTYLVDRLAERGLVERRECQTDRRAKYAALTPAGESLMRRIFPLHAAYMRRALAGLTEPEQQFATDLLRRLGHHAARVASEGGPA